MSGLVFKADNGSGKAKICRTAMEISTGPWAQGLPRTSGQVHTDSGAGR